MPPKLKTNVSSNLPEDCLNDGNKRAKDEHDSKSVLKVTNEGNNLAIEQKNSPDAIKDVETEEQRRLEVEEEKAIAKSNKSKARSKAKNGEYTRVVDEYDADNRHSERQTDMARLFAERNGLKLSDKLKYPGDSSKALARLQSRKDDQSSSSKTPI